MKICQCFAFKIQFIFLRGCFYLLLTVSYNRQLRVKLAIIFGLSTDVSNSEWIRT